LNERAYGADNIKLFLANLKENKSMQTVATYNIPAIVVKGK
jgi:hypothetical protein